MSRVKDRLYHPEIFLQKMLTNWEPNAIESQATQRLLSEIQNLDMDAIRCFGLEFKNKNSHGSAFHSVLSFAEEFIDRYDKKPRSTMILESIRNARLTIFSESVSKNLTLLKRSDGASTVAFLVTLGLEENLLIPLADGTNLVGRGGTKGPYGTWPKPYAVEQYQWFIDCEGNQVEIRDASSTNLSLLLPSAYNLVNQASAKTSLLELPGSFEIPHPNEPGVKYRWMLDEGDVLQNCYATFVFAWL